INGPWKDDHDLHKALQLSLQECSLNQRYATFEKSYYCFTITEIEMVGACKRSRSIVRQIEGDLALKSTSSVSQQVDSTPVQSPDAKRHKGKRKVEEFGFMHRAICFESKEGTVATECKVDFME
ncbi:unnamed protein product, partial [Pocillopora meandrina]